jgi:phage-related minor tail protein
MDDAEIGVNVSLDARAFATTLSELESNAERFGGTMTRALRSAIVDGRDLESVLRGVARRLSDIALDAGLKPLQTALGGAVAGFADRFVSRVVPFAKGGVVAAPTYFPAGGDIGLMGEAGAEAILPLARGSDGRLGVSAGAGSGATNIVFNVTASDAASFARSEAQLSAMLTRVVARGRRGL